MSDEEEDEPKCEWHWSDTEHGRGVLVHENKLNVTFHPNGSFGCVALRGTKQLIQNKQHYFEVKFISPFHGQARAVGIGTKHTLLQSHHMDFYPLLGKDHCSWGFNYNGTVSHHGNTRQYTNIDPDKHEAICVGVHYDGYYGTLSFEINNKSYGVAFNNITPNLELYPMICASARNTEVELTECYSSVMSLRALCRGVIRMQITDEKDFDKLPLPAHIKAYVTFRAYEPKPLPKHSSKARNAKHRKFRESAI